MPLSEFFWIPLRCLLEIFFDFKYLFLFIFISYFA